MFKMYVVKEKSLYVLRQVRFKAALAENKEDARDVCVYATTVEEMHSMADKYYEAGEIDYSAVEGA